MLGTSAVDDFLNTQVCVELGIVDMPWGINNRSQHF
jgi:hypothetical protein